MRITRNIKASTNADSDYDVFMIMDYSSGDSGMESDQFNCLGKFFARDINDAKQQLERCARKYPELAEGLYVTEYNEYFDNFDEFDPDNYWSNEVFQNLETIFRKWDDNQAEYDEYMGDDPLPFVNASEDIMVKEDHKTKVLDELYSANNRGESMTIKSSTHSYGGAYDIEDDMFFNKEEIVEWANEIVDKFNNTNDELFDVDDVYFTDTTHIVLEISNGDLVLNASVNIDMRKIRKPSDISKYTEEMLYQLQSGYDEFYSYGIESCNKITSASEYDVPDRELEPPAETEYLEQADSQDEVEIDLPDILVTVDEDGDIDYADDDFDWIKSVDFSSNEYSELMLDDWDGAADNILELIESVVPAAKGTYKVTGYATLVYDISGVESEVTDTWENEEGGQETWEETYTDNAECTFNFRASSLNDITVEEA